MPQVRLIDADSHISEVGDLWTSRVPAKFVDQVPHMVRGADGRDVWVLGGETIAVVGRSAPVDWAGFPPEYPPRFDDIHPAAHSAAERIKYLDHAGIWAQVLYPNVAGFGAQRFLRISDQEVKLLAVRAWNDFLHEEWISQSPERLLPTLSLPFWDVEASVAEIERGAGHGFRGVLFTGEPQRFGFPYLGDRHWDPVYAAAQAHRMPIHFHIGGAETGSEAQPRIAAHGYQGAMTYGAVSLFLKNGVQTADLLLSGVLERFPELKFVSVESGIGWLPFTLEACDYHWVRSGAVGTRSSQLLPSELFRRQVYSTFWFEEIAPHHLLDVLPVDNILFETDFPHITCLYENIEETIATGLRYVPEDTRHKFLWDNAARLYNIAEPPADWRC
jgi:uncharacterized protein